MTTTLADTLSAIEEKASPGDWRVTTCLDYWIEHSRTPTKADEGFKGVGHFGDVSWPNADKRQVEWEANAALIVALRNNLPEILAALREREAMRAALEKIANGPVGTLDPIGDGGTYCLTGNEWLDFRNIARQALSGGGDA